MEQEKSGALIAAARKEKGLTQQELGKRLGVSDRAVSNWERGVRFPDIVLLEDLSAVLGLSVLELLHGERMENAEGEEMEQAVREALYAQKKELTGNCLRITLMCVLCTVMLCLAGKYAFLLDRVMLLNIRSSPGTWIEIGIALVIGIFFRRAISEKKTFYSVALGMMVLWVACETVNAVVMQQDVIALIGLAGFAGKAGWLLLWGMIGAWLMHGVLWLKSLWRKRGQEVQA